MIEMYNIYPCLLLKGGTYLGYLDVSLLGEDEVGLLVPLPLDQEVQLPCNVRIKVKEEYSIVVTNWHTHPEIERSKHCRCSDPALADSPNAYLLKGSREAFICDVECHHVCEPAIIQARTS